MNLLRADKYVKSHTLNVTQDIKNISVFVFKSFSKFLSFFYGNVLAEFEELWSEEYISF